ncbi:hypothetical protein BP6252_05956 [Coleophoma cylindrospora]|uniref:Cytochrome P450 n=1 Tax=Coleophoma cylindrospora TaxID=1849047 RepID=A0A3D8RLP1_9HELO|nr:hypothetical protein BP6252_05956 [Coleophoma cylindrospora]
MDDLSSRQEHSGLAQALLSPSILTILGFALTLIYLYREAYRTNFPKLANIPEVPGSLPFVGHLPSLGGRLKLNDASIFKIWTTQAKSDIVQVKLGDQRTIVLSTWAAMKSLWIDQNNAMLDRVHQPGFVDNLGIDISGSPLTEQIRKCRNAALKALGKPMWPEYYRLMEPNSAALTRSLYKDGENGKISMDLYPLLRQGMVDLTLSLTYGVRVGEFDEEFTNALLDSIATISSIRSSTVSYKHYVPLLRIFPEKTSRTIKAVKERTERINILFETYLHKVEKGQADLKCIVSSLGNDKLTLEEIHGTCVSLLQAAPDTVASAVYQCCAWLCSPEGLPFQKEAYDAILEAYDGDRDEAWRMAFREEKVPLIVSLYKETLRFYPTAPFGSRRTSKSFELNGTTIPKGMGVLMDTQGVNHDLDFYGSDAYSFNPRRFIGNDSPLPHLTYGTGGRICPAYQISNRVMSAMLVKLILAFDMKPVAGGRLPSIARNDFSDAYGNVQFSRTFDCSFTARNESWLKGVIAAEKL